MSATEILLIPVVFLALFGFWFFYGKPRKSRPRTVVMGRLRMCPSCGRITPRSKSACLECGKVLAT